MSTKECPFCGEAPVEDEGSVCCNTYACPITDRWMGLNQWNTRTEDKYLQELSTRIIELELMIIDIEKPKTCRDCRWWKEDTLTCKHIKNNMQNIIECCGPDFGCIHWIGEG